MMKSLKLFPVILKCYTHSHNISLTATVESPSVRHSEPDNIAPLSDDLRNSIHAKYSELEYPPSSNAHIPVSSFCFYIKFPYPHLPFCKVCENHEFSLDSHKLHSAKKLI
jgi:hypothetical protein